MMRWLVILSLLVMTGGCREHALERHLRTALDVLTAEQASRDAVRSACPDAATCPDVYEAQHRLVDAHHALVDALQHEVSEDDWRRPETADELSAVCAALSAYRDTLVARSLTLTLSRRVTAACRIEAGDE